jgi:hypothetical protein
VLVLNTANATKPSLTFFLMFDIVLVAPLQKPLKLREFEVDYSACGLWLPPSKARKMVCSTALKASTAWFALTHIPLE